MGGAFHLLAQDPIEVVRRLKAETSTKDIWLCGGGLLAGVLRNEIDRLVLKVNPVLLGTGIPLFGPGGAHSQPFTLESTRSFDSGVYVATYRADR